MTWPQIGVFIAVVLVTFVVGLTLLPLIFGWYGVPWAMGPGMMQGGTSEGWCPVCGGTGRYSGGFVGGLFGWVLMFMAILFPLGLLALLGLGIVWVARAVGRPMNHTPSSGQTCPRCGRPVAVDWRACPYCQEDLERLG
jgi:hypothetical protein